MGKIHGFLLYRIWYGDTLAYLGRTKQPLQTRIHGHLFKKPMHRSIAINLVTKIEYATFQTEADMNLYEIYFINLWKPPLNIDDKCRDNLTVTLPDVQWYTFTTPLWGKWEKEIEVIDKTYEMQKQEKAAKKELNRYYIREDELTVINDITKMKLVSEEMSLRNIPYKNTTLLYGASGTGKTELGRYIAYKLKLPFFYISFSSTIDSYMGSTAKNIHKIFDFCNSIPCVLMLDEIDCVATKRCAAGSNGVDGELERTTISLMQELDRLPNHVTLIAATNRLDMVDDAMMRRFSIKHEIRNMSESELLNLANQFMNATDTQKYVNDEIIQCLAKQYENPGQLMPELIKEIGRSIYDEKKDTLLKEEEGEENPLNVWEVAYIWKTNVSAETEEDAIAIASHERGRYGCQVLSEEYIAKRADFLYANAKA